MRVLCAVAAVAAMVVPGTALTATALEANPSSTEAAPVRLGAVNHVAFVRPGVLDVSLPADAVMDFPLSGRNRDLDVEGRGRFVGFLLASADGEFDYDASLLVLAGHYRRCSAAGCNARPRPVTHPLGLERYERIDLPAGDYRLYLINDGAPARLTLRLDGLDGEVRLPAARPAHVDVREPEVQASAGGVYAAGQTQRIARSTLSWNTRWFVAEPSVVTEFGTCVYEDRPPVPDELAYFHTCRELGAHGHGHQMVAPAAWMRGEAMTFETLDPGLRGHGMYVETTAPRARSGSLNVLVGY